MMEHSGGDGRQLLPIVPVPDSVFHLAESINEFGIGRLFGKAQNVTQFFDFETIGVKVIVIQICGLCEFAGKMDGDTGGRGCGWLAISGIFIGIRNAPDEAR